jgi:RHS repeat-associated protein
MYTGQEREGTTAGEMYYYGARYYDPGLGRFISPDPLVGELNFAGIGRIDEYGKQRKQETSAGLVDPKDYVLWNGLNSYAYCNNNPLCFTDPTGMIIKPQGLFLLFAYNNAKNYLSKSATANMIINKLDGAKKTIYIYSTEGHSTIEHGFSDIIDWNPNKEYTVASSGKKMSSALSLAHELATAYANLYDTEYQSMNNEFNKMGNKVDDTTKEYNTAKVNLNAGIITNEEFEAIKTERNALLKEYALTVQVVCRRPGLLTRQKIRYGKVAIRGHLTITNFLSPCTALV